MSIATRFWSQSCREYRDFQVVFALLTLNFVIPAVSYALRPEIAAGQFVAINHILGGIDYLFPEAGSRVWRYLAAANVMTLGLMCFLMQYDLRKYRVVLVPLCFLKAYNATLFLAGWYTSTGLPALLAIAIFDYVTSAAFAFFSLRAFRAIQTVGDGNLIPRPGFLRL